MSCPACGHDLCLGDCPPNAPLVFEYCIVCGEREELDDLSTDLICGDCENKGYALESIECQACGVVLDSKDFAQGALPFRSRVIRGLTVYVCPECELKPDEEVL